MVAKESNLRLVIAGLMLGILMAAMDNTIVATSNWYNCLRFGVDWINSYGLLLLIWLQLWRVCLFSGNYLICMVERGFIFLVY